MVRAPYFDKDGTRKGAWSEDEDCKLKSYIMKYGHRNWRELPNLAGLSRCGKSCRLRWVNYLRPNVKRGNYTSEEEDLIIDLHNLLGSKWSMIASKLPGRSDNEIKNHWHTHLRKRANQNNIHPNLDSDEEKDVIKLSHVKEKDVIKLSHVKEKEESGILVKSLSSKSSSSSVKTEETSSSLSSDLYNVALNNNSSTLSNNVEFEDFWTTPFLPDTFSSKSSPEYLPSSMGVLDNYYFSSYDHDMIMVDDLVW